LLFTRNLSVFISDVEKLSTGRVDVKFILLLFCVLPNYIFYKSNMTGRPLRIKEGSGELFLPNHQSGCTRKKSKITFFVIPPKDGIQYFQ